MKHLEVNNRESIKSVSLPVFESFEVKCNESQS